MIDPSKKGCIECQPIVLLPKTMINLRAWCCFHHNPHHPVVRTVVADQTMIAESVLKFSCPYSTLRAATNVHFLPIYDIAAGWLAGCSPQLCLYGNVLHQPRLQGNCWVCCKYCFVQNALRFMQCVCTSSGSETNMLARLLVIIFIFVFFHRICVVLIIMIGMFWMASQSQMCLTSD